MIFGVIPILFSAVTHQDRFFGVLRYTNTPYNSLNNSRLLLPIE